MKQLQLLFDMTDVFDGGVRVTYMVRPQRSQASTWSISYPPLTRGARDDQGGSRLGLSAAIPKYLPPITSRMPKLTIDSAHNRADRLLA
jgi:hypothetical protein